MQVADDKSLTAQVARSRYECCQRLLPREREITGGGMKGGKATPIWRNIRQHYASNPRSEGKAACGLEERPRGRTRVFSLTTVRT